MKKRLFLSICLLIAVLGLTILFMPAFIPRALLYGHVNINDYNIFSNREVKSGPAIPWANDSLYNELPIDTSSLRTFKSYGTVAYVVVKNNKIIHEEYWDGYNDSSYSNSFSMAKSIISLLIGCLVDDGKIKSLDQSVSDFLPEFKQTEGKTLHIKDLLTMSSGIDWDESYSSLFSPTTQAYYGQDLPGQMFSLHVKDQPSIRFNYQSCNPQILGLIIERASGKHIADYASEKLWKPLGAEHPALWCLDKEDGTEKAYCCFNTNARDFARIGQMVLDSGRFANRQIVSKQYIVEATSPALWLKDEDGNACDQYGYLFWMLTYKGHKVVYARGILGQYIFIIPSLNPVIVRLGEQRSNLFKHNVPDDVFVYLDAAFHLIN